MLTVILTGGTSRRMGTDKACLEIFPGKTLLETLVERYERELGKVAVSVGRPGQFETFGAMELVDAFPGKGPINGLYSAFTQTRAEAAFLTAIDLPNGDAALAGRLYDMLPGYDGVVIRRDGAKFEPAFAVYAASCLDAAERALRSGELSFVHLFERLKIRYVSERELARWDLDKVLVNINTPEELRRFIRLFRT